MHSLNPNQKLDGSSQIILLGVRGSAHGIDMWVHPDLQSVLLAGEVFVEAAAEL